MPRPPYKALPPRVIGWQMWTPLCMWVRAGNRRSVAFALPQAQDGTRPEDYNLHSLETLDPLQ